MAHVVLFADGPGERRSELATEFAEVIRQVGDPAPDLIETARETFLRRARLDLTQPGVAEWAEAGSLARALLHGWEPQTIAEQLVEAESVGTDQVHAVGRQLLSSALFALPNRTRLEPVFGTAAPASVAEPVTGRHVFRHRDAPVVDTRLSVSPYGVTVRNAGAPVATVRFHQLAGVLRWPDGAVELVGEDACRVSVEPTLWRDGRRLRSLLERHLAEVTSIDQGERPRKDVPTPRTTWAGRLRARFHRARSRLLIPLIAGMLGIGLVALTTAIARPIALWLAVGLTGGTLGVLRSRGRSGRL